ncbi:MAG: hypothetical protein ACI4B6_02535, partial [Atopobiaceae bacterium]
PESVMTGVPEPEPEPVMSKAQAAVAARIAAAQARMGGTAAGAAAGARAAEASEPASIRGAVAATAASAAPAAQTMAAEQAVDQPHGADMAYEAEAAVNAAEPVAASAAMSEPAVADAGATAHNAGANASVQNVAASNAAAPGVAASGAAADSSPVAASGPVAATTPIAPAANAKAQPGTTLPVASIQAFFDAIKAQESPKHDSAQSGHGRPGSKQGSSRKGRASEPEVIHMPLDYATRYSNRMWDVFDAISPQVDGLTAAQVARRMHCDSVEPLQRALNAEEVPSFQLVDEFCHQLGVSHAYLESADDQAPKAPIFVSVRELESNSSQCGASQDGTNLAVVLGDADPCQIVFVKESGREHRAVVLLRYDRLRCLLLDRSGVSVDDAEAAQSDASDAKKGQVVQAFLRMVHDLQDFCMRSQAEITSVDVSSEVWRRLTQGRIWPGEVCR